MTHLLILGMVVFLVCLWSWMMHLLFLDMVVLLVCLWSWMMHLLFFWYGCVVGVFMVVDDAPPDSWYGCVIGVFMVVDDAPPVPITSGRRCS